MSRTRGYLSPCRKSKRLYENGYYEIKQKNASLGIGCIACNSSPKYEKSLSQNSSSNPSHTLAGCTPKNRSRKFEKESGSISSLPNLNHSNTNFIQNAMSFPAVLHQRASCKPSNKLFSGHSSETLAAGERITTKKKLNQVSPATESLSQNNISNYQVKQSQVLTSSESSVYSPPSTRDENLVEADSQLLWSYSDDELKKDESSDESSEAASLYEAKHDDHSYALVLEVLQFMFGHFIRIVLAMFKFITKLIVSDIVAVIRDARAFAGLKLFLKLSLCMLLVTLVAVYVVGSLPLLFSSARRLRSYLQVISPPFRTSLILSSTRPQLLEQNIQKLELSLEEMQLSIADRHASLTKSIEEMKKTYEDNNLKISENHKNVMSEVESMIGRAIALELLKNNEVFQSKVEDLQVAMNVLQANHSTMVGQLEKEIYDKVGMTQSIYQPLVDQLDEFKRQIFLIESKIKGFIKEHKDFRTSVEQHSENVTFLREISNQQFIENFLLLLQKGANINIEQEQISERHHHKYLAYILLEWLARRGFVDEKLLKKVQDQTGRNFTKLQNNIKETLDKNLAIMRKVSYKSGITLDSLSPSSRMNEGTVKMLIKDAIDRYSSDRIGIPDYALESAGATIVTSRCSSSFQHKTALLSLLGIPIYYNANGPRFIIQPGVMPGECWAFKGSKGHAVVSLSATIRPESVTIDHIPKSLAFDSISSAPKDFAVYGLKSPYDSEGKLLGIFRFEESGESIQQFVLDDVGDSFGHIELKVNSNWGQPDYTCLYRFRVHGRRLES